MSGRFGGWEGRAASGLDGPLYPHMFLLRNGKLLYAGGYMGGAAGAVPGVTDPVTGGFSAISATAPYAHRDQAASVMLPSARAHRFPTHAGRDPPPAAVASGNT